MESSDGIPTTASETGRDSEWYSRPNRPDSGVPLRGFPQGAAMLCDSAQGTGPAMLIIYNVMYEIDGGVKRAICHADQ
jgi:hypothetical protein